MKKIKFVSFWLLLTAGMATVVFNSCGSSGAAKTGSFSKVAITAPKSIDVKILECEPEGDKVVMTLLLTNRGEEISYYLIQKGRAIDNLGNEYATSFAFGQKTGSNYTSLSTGVPIKLYIKIGNSGQTINSKATHFAVVEATAYSGDKYTFKNVPLK